MISGFDWDDGKLDKCRKRGVSRLEIEFVLSSPALMVFPDPHPHEVRRRGVGVTEDGRHVFVVWTIRPRESGQFIRPISARYMHQKESDHYERSQEP